MTLLSCALLLFGTVGVLAYVSKWKQGWALANGIMPTPPEMERGQPYDSDWPR
jgi:hypothetical protein